MSQMIQGTEKIADIVTKYPATSAVLKEYKIDFCCGGNRPLSEAIAEKHLNDEEIVEKLNEAYTNSFRNDEVNWDTADDSSIIDHIISTHHAYLNQTLPELSGYVTKVFRVHGSVHPELADVHQLFHALKTDLEQHTMKEETAIFPLIKDYDVDPSEDKLFTIQKGITELESEHDASGDILKKLREITNDYTLPLGACTTYQLTFQKLEELESDLFQHIHLENNILFRRMLEKEH